MIRFDKWHVHFYENPHQNSLRVIDPKEHKWKCFKEKYIHGQIETQFIQMFILFLSKNKNITGSDNSAYHFEGYATLLKQW